MGGNTDSTADRPLPGVRMSRRSQDMLLSCDLQLDAETDLADLPAARGVVAFETSERDTLYLAVCADIRRTARRRLSPPTPEQRHDRGRELRSATSRILAWVVGSPFEADCLYLDLVRDRLPGEHRAAISAWQAWFLHINADEPFPRWMKVAVPGWSHVSRAPGGDLIGPFRDKKAAGKYAETLDDIFDLCRYHSVLTQAPHGSACAYKEMGKCPAPCDGSETMASYKARLRKAINLARTGTAHYRASTEARMNEAAAALDFETAERRKSRLDTLRTIEAPSFRCVSTMDAMAWIVVSAAERRGWVRLSVALPGRVRALASLRAADAAAAVDELAPMTLAELANHTKHAVNLAELSESERELLGLIGAAAHNPAAAKAGLDIFIELRGDDCDAWPRERILRAAKKVVRSKPAPDDDDDGKGARESLRADLDAGHSGADESP
ncbi:MAG: hypothetical protein EA376_12210 [Phycisphaeraceae bacterium]|nr:MAG: hypothetical protein EA376_12210 [Phycisphaeraceae bacterium]